jgi:flagellar biosynthesis/type III secretory pathway protein FliH
LRAPWDQQRSDSFGPWRLGERVDPALPLHEMPAAAGAPGGSGTSQPELRADVRAEGGDVTDVQSREVGSGEASANPQALADAEARGHARGLEEGRAQALADLEAERTREAELIRHLAIELRALAEDPDRFFEPLRRLALHIAEQLVRGELQASPQAVSQIVRQALAALDPPPGAQILVGVHPDDARLLQESAPSFLEGLKLQAEPQLHRGSVRLRLDDTVLEDLIEHRLQALVERLMVQGSGLGAGLSESVLVRDLPSASPLAGGSPRRRSAGMGDVIDAEPSSPEGQP